MKRCAVLFSLALLVSTETALRGAQFKFPTQTLTVPDGFEVELVAGPPLVDRPMMAEFDELGRLYVADSSGSNAKVEKQLEEKPHRIVRLEDTDGDGRYDRSMVFADRMMFPEGVLWHDGAVYSGAPPTIWKLEDTDGDGKADKRTEWFQGKTLTGCANDLHGPYLGPDGWIYWCKGAFAKQTHERPGRTTISDSASHIFRCKPDGSEFDSVMSGGMDNPVEITFSPEGEVFFITTFFTNPEGGKRDAIVHAIYGGVYPKVHGVLDPLKKTGELMPAMIQLGPAAACGLTRYESSAFGAEFEGNLFSALFNLRKVMRHVLTPAGATFKSRDQDFLVSDNMDFHPTDVFEDADGSLLVIDTGGWYKICCPTSQLAKPDVLGAIYRVRRKGAPKIEDARGLKLAWNVLKAGDLTELLADPRPFVRKRAIYQLGKQGAAAVPALAGTLKSAGSVEGRRNAVWALTRIAGAAARDAVRAAMSDASGSVQHAALHSVGMHRDAAALAQVQGFLQSSSPSLQRKAAEVLGQIGAKSAVPALLAAAATPHDRIQEHSLIYALIDLADVPATTVGLRAASPHTRRAALIALDQMDGGGLQASEVAPLLAAADATLKRTAGWIAGHHPEWGKELAGFFHERLTRGLLNEADQAELQRQLAQFGRDTAIQELMAQTLGNAATPADTRRLLLRAMAQAGLKELPARWLSELPHCLSGPDEATLRTAVATLRALPPGKTNAGEVTAALLRVAREPARAADLRLEALAALPTGLPVVEPVLFDLLRQGLEPNLPPPQRGAAAGVLAKAKLSEEQLLALAEAMKGVGPMEISRLLEAYEGNTSEPVGLSLVAALKECKALSSVRVDLLKQRLAKYPATVQKAGGELLVLLDVDPAKQAARLDQLSAQIKGGDVRRGQAVFNGAKAACVTCHAMGYLGGKVGPDLTSIGQIRTERDMLEAIVYPSASFVRSYEPLIVSTKDGEDYSGVVRDETVDDIVLATGADTEVRVARKNIAEMRPGTVSTMPQGLDEQLSRQELGDLLAFLKATKWGAQ